MSGAFFIRMIRASCASPSQSKQSRLSPGKLIELRVALATPSAWLLVQERRGSFLDHQASSPPTCPRMSSKALVFSSTDAAGSRKTCHGDFALGSVIESPRGGAARRTCASPFLPRCVYPVTIRFKICDDRTGRGHDLPNPRHLGTTTIKRPARRPETFPGRGSYQGCRSPGLRMQL